MGRYTSEAISLSDLFSIQVEADDEAELEQKINSVITAVSILGEEFLVTSIEIDGSGRRARRKKDGQYVAIIEYSNSVSEGLDAAGHRVYCYATPALGRSGNGSAAALDSSRSAAYARATAEGYTDVRDTLFSGSSALRSKFLCALVVRGVGGIWAASASIYSRSGFREDQQLPELSNSRLRILTFDSGGYTAPISSDVGKGVVGASTGDTATLLSYDNTKRMWVVLGDDALDLFDEAESVSVIAGTGSGTTAGAAVLGYAPENTDPVPTSIQLSYLGSGVLSGTYRDGSRVACSVVGTYDVGTGALTFSGTGGDWAVSGAGTYSLSALSVTTDVSRISGNSVETRTFLGAPGAQIDFGTEYYVDQIAGDDGNSATTPTDPTATISGLLAAKGGSWEDGDTIRIARGSLLRESIIDNHDSVTVMAYGVGPRPVMDSSVVITSWVSLGGGTPHVYTGTLTPGYVVTGNATYLVAENGIVMIRVGDDVTCEATPNSFVAPDPDGSPSYPIHIHPSDSGDPNLNGKVYEAASLEGSVVLTGDGCFISSIHGRLNAGDDGSLSVKGSVGTLYDCIFEWGGLHNWYATSGALVEKCVALWQGKATAGGSLGVIYVADGDGKSAIVMDYAAIQYDRPDLLSLATTAILAHVGGGGDPWDSIFATGWGAYGCGKGLAFAADLHISTLGLFEKSQGAIALTCTNTADGGSLVVSKTRSYNHSMGGTQPTVSRAFSTTAAGDLTAEDILVTTPGSGGGEMYSGGDLSIQQYTCVTLDRTATTCAVDDSAVTTLVTFHQNNLYVDMDRGLRQTSTTTDGIVDGQSDHNQCNGTTFWQLKSGATQYSFTNWIANYTTTPTYDQNSTTDAPTFLPEEDPIRPVYKKTDVFVAGNEYEFAVEVDQPTYNQFLVFVRSL